MGTKSEHVVILNDLSGTTVEQRERKSGKQHVTISFKSEPIAVHLDPVALGRPVAVAIRDAISEGIKRIGEAASESTLYKRALASSAFTRGAAWAQRKYSGGRIGPKAPNQTEKAFNDSGRLADGITVNPNPKEGGFTLNAPVNRLDPSGFSSMAAFNRMVERLISLVPALRAPLDEPSVKEAIERTWVDMHVKAAMSAADKQSQLVGKMVLEILRLGKTLLT
jgi:hypothetical protein